MTELFVKWRQDRWQYAAIGSVILLHGVLIWVISVNIQTPNAPPVVQEIHVSLVPRADLKQLPEPKITEPLAPIVTAPEIVIENENSNTSLGGTSAAAVLAPRPDPSHPNAAPSHLAGVQTVPVGASLVLRVFVTADGAITDASVVTSSGTADIDQATIDYVKSNWRFLPALLGGKAIPYWTTVLVRLAPG